MWSMRDLVPWNRAREIGPGRRPAEHPLMTVQREVDRLFDDLWRGFDLPGLRREGFAGVVSPRIDVRETDTEYTVRAELPGLDEKDVEVTLDDDTLVVRGEKKLETTAEKEGYTYSECSYGAFERRIPLTGAVVQDRVSAAFEKGVLTVTLPKSLDAQKHVMRIPIGGSSAGGGEGQSKAA